MASRKNRLVVRRRGILTTIGRADVAGTVRTLTPDRPISKAARAVNTCLGAYSTVTAPRQTAPQATQQSQHGTQVGKFF